MKILHTADWHIGKLVHGLHMTEDQKYLLQELIELLKTEEVDVLIIAGDVYDRSIPPTEAVELLDDVLSKVVLDLGINVIMISGNHDSPDRLDFGSKLLRDRGLHIVGKLQKRIEPVILEDEYGEVHFYPIPFSEPAVVKALYQKDALTNHDMAMKTVLTPITEELDQNIRNICISHAFVVGTEEPETSESERPLSIGGSEYVSAEYYHPFDYVALGHLHRPQKVSKESIRYAGSLLKYSFSEAKQKKSVTLIDLKEKGEMTIDERVLKPRRDLRVIEGDLEDLMNPEVYSLGNTEDYIHAVLTDPGSLYEQMQKLRSVYPNILQLERVRMELLGDHGDEVVEMKGKNPRELFLEFYRKVTGEEEPTKEALEYFSEVYEEIEREERDA